MRNPFDNDNAHYLVLVNDCEQQSLWPADLDVPVGWRVRHGPDSRAACLAHVEATWTDLRPAAAAAGGTG